MQRCGIAAAEHAPWRDTEDAAAAVVVVVGVVGADAVVEYGEENVAYSSLRQDSGA